MRTTTPMVLGIAVSTLLVGLAVPAVASGGPVSGGPVPGGPAQPATESTSPSTTPSWTGRRILEIRMQPTLLVPGGTVTITVSPACPGWAESEAFDTGAGPFPIDRPIRVRTDASGHYPVRVTCQVSGDYGDSFLVVVTPPTTEPAAPPSDTPPSAYPSGGVGTGGGGTADRTPRTA